MCSCSEVSCISNSAAWRQIVALRELAFTKNLIPTCYKSNFWKVTSQMICCVKYVNFVPNKLNRELMTKVVKEESGDMNFN